MVLVLLVFREGNGGELQVESKGCPPMVDLFSTSCPDDRIVTRQASMFPKLQKGICHFFKIYIAIVVPW